MPAKRISKEERKRNLRDRTKSNIKTKDSGGVQGKKILDLSKYEDVEFFKPKKGTNRIDIIPYMVSTDNHPQGLKQGFEDYVLDVWVHGWVGPSEDSFICLKKTFGKACPICEEIQSMMQSENPNEQQIKSMKAKRRCVYNVIDADDEENPDKIKLWEISHFLFEKELLEEAETAEDDVIIFSDTEEGRTIRFRASQEQMEGGKPFYKFKSFTFERRKKPYKESIVDKAFPLDALLVVPSYDDVKNAFLGMDEDEDVVNRDDDDAEEDRKTSSKKDSGKKAESSKKKGKCPHGHVLGKDCDEHDECDDCDDWDDCANERDRLADEQEDD